jgi:hypothetical protein
MIIHSTKLSTEALVIAQYGGTRWLPHSGYFLRGATSGVTDNSATKTGGNDNAVVVQHSHALTQGGVLVKTTNTGGRFDYTGGSEMNWYTTMTLSAINNSGWSDGTNANIPNYKSVYIWERIA